MRKFGTAPDIECEDEHAIDGNRFGTGMIGVREVHVGVINEVPVFVNIRA